MRGVESEALVKQFQLDREAKKQGGNTACDRMGAAGLRAREGGRVRGKKKCKSGSLEVGVKVKRTAYGQIGNLSAWKSYLAKAKEGGKSSTLASGRGHSGDKPVPGALGQGD